MKSLSAFNLTIHHLYSKYTLCDQCLNYVLQQFKFKTCLELWVYSLSDPFKLQTTSLLLLLSLIQNLQCTTNQQCNILSGSTLMVPEASQSMLPASALIWQLQCPHYLNIAITILEYWRCRHLRTAVLLFWSVLLFLLVCVTRSFLWFETSPSIRILNSCRDVQRSYEHNLCQFLLQFQTGRSWHSKFKNYSHLKTFLTFFVENDL
jgi:hypothetical protein